MRRRHPDVQVAAVAIRGDRGDLRALVRERGWRFPVAHDRDGVLANLFGVAACPQVTYVLPGGRVRETTVGEDDAARLDAPPVGARARGARAGMAAVTGGDGAPEVEAGWVAERLARGAARPGR